MQSFFFLLLKHKPIHTKLLSEIDAAYDSGKLSYPHVQWGEAQINIPYFQACLKESMRLRPAVGLNISRQVPAAGAEIDGKWFPGGTRLAVNGWVLHRDKEMFGQDADLYRPERWLEDPEKARIMERHMFQVCGIALTLCCITASPHYIFHFLLHSIVYFVSNVCS